MMGPWFFMEYVNPFSYQLKTVLFDEFLPHGYTWQVNYFPRCIPSFSQDAPNKAALESVQECFRQAPFVWSNNSRHVLSRRNCSSE
uniref:Uncharacterized protein n=1 Tax=Anguilla anguilla TaxID=7936 RepID=A0A0E9T1Y5_ANGAN